MTLITREMQDSVGMLLHRRVSFPISESDIRRWAVAVYWPELPPQHYWDIDYAAKHRRAGFVAPQEFDPFAWMVAEEDSIAEADPPRFKFRLNGGVSMEYRHPMRPGDVITGIRSIGEFGEGHGKLGPMLLSTTVDRWTNQRDQLVKTHNFTTIWYDATND